MRKPFLLGKEMNERLEEIPTYEEVTDAILSNLTPDDIKPLFETITAIVDALTRALDRYIDVIILKGAVHGYNLTVRAVSCGAKRCGTCLGRLKTHYPYFYQTENGRKDKVREARLVKIRHELIGEEKTKIFLDIRDFRHYFIQVYNYLYKLLSTAGVLEFVE